MSFNIRNPKMSQSLNHYGDAILTDQNDNELPLLAILPVDSAGEVATDDMTVTKVNESQVTALENKPQVNNIPVMAVCGLDSDGEPIAFGDVVKSYAEKKFQSDIRTATGSEESIDHGMGVVPSLVLVSVYDNNAADFVVTEGDHTFAQLKVTVTAGAKYKIIAME